jgi:hypothetical protein
MSDDMANLIKLVVNQGLAKFSPHLLPRVRADSVDHVNENSIKQGETQDLQGNTDQLLLWGNSGVFAPQNRTDQFADDFGRFGLLLNAT